MQELRFRQEEKHKLEWDFKHKAEEVIELTRVLEEQKLTLFEERSKNLEYKKENNDLRIKEMEDRKKIEELMSIARPLE